LKKSGRSLSRREGDSPRRSLLRSLQGGISQGWFGFMRVRKCTHTGPLPLYFPKNPRCPCPPCGEVSDLLSAPISGPRSCCSFRVSCPSGSRSSSADGARCTCFRYEEILLEVDDCADLPEFALLSVFTRLRPVIGLTLMELMRVKLGEGVTDLEPSRWRPNWFCSCRLRSTFLRCFLRSNSRYSSR
jgi:hypothetical protein